MGFWHVNGSIHFDIGQCFFLVCIASTKYFIPPYSRTFTSTFIPFDAVQHSFILIIMILDD